MFCFWNEFCFFEGVCFLIMSAAVKYTMIMHPSSGDDDEDDDGDDGDDGDDDPKPRQLSFIRNAIQALFKVLTNFKMAVKSK